MLCFNKLTDEHNAKNIPEKIFVLWEYIFKLEGNPVALNIAF